MRLVTTAMRIRELLGEYEQHHMHKVPPDTEKAERNRRAAEDIAAAMSRPTEEELAFEPILQFFSFAHLPEYLRDTSHGFAVMAVDVVRTLPRNPERTVALRKLLEAKDAAVRAALFK